MSNRHCRAPLLPGLRMDSGGDSFLSLSALGRVDISLQPDHGCDEE
jgi:hypothetical protein